MNKRNCIPILLILFLFGVMDRLAAQTPKEIPTGVEFTLSHETTDEETTVTLTWTLDKSFNHLIENFVVYRKKKMFGDPVTLGTVDSKNRKYVDKSIEHTGNYYYEVEAVPKKGMRIKTNSEYVYKKIVNKPKAPSGLSGKVSLEGETHFVNLSWDKHTDPSVVGYHLYTDGVMSGGLALEGSIGTIEASNYKYEIPQRFGANYRFAVSAVKEDGAESDIVDTLNIFVPSKSLPKVNIWPIDKQANVITLNWKYNHEIEDHAGFRLYQNGELIADESELTTDATQWKSPELDPGKYAYTIEAVSRSDVASEPSQARTFTIE